MTALVCMFGEMCFVGGRHNFCVHVDQCEHGRFDRDLASANTGITPLWHILLVFGIILCRDYTIMAVLIGIWHHSMQGLHHHGVLIGIWHHSMQGLHRHGCLDRYLSSFYTGIIPSWLF